MCKVRPKCSRLGRYFVLRCVVSWAQVSLLLNIVSKELDLLSIEKIPLLRCVELGQKYIWTFAT